MSSDWQLGPRPDSIYRPDSVYPSNGDSPPGDALSRADTYTLERTDTIRSVAGGWLKLRGRNDSLPQRWWFASTAIPLVAATIGPLSNVLSIVALATTWRVALADDGQLPGGTDDSGVDIEDPKWELALNAFSLVCGFAGNFFLLLNFTGRVRYIVALPLSIVFWMLASMILIATTSAMNVYAAPVPPGEIYSQGFWHAVLASILYFLGAVILFVNLLGYLRGHYPQQFDLDDDQRTLILQTMMFFFWLAGGAAIFGKVEGWGYADALYYADVVSSVLTAPRSILTIGFGDLYPSTDAARGFLFVFELFGIIFLGLVISSISRFASNISADKIIKTHQQHARESTVGRTVTNEGELRERLGLPPRRPSSVNSSTARRESLKRYGSLQITGRTVTFREKKVPARGGGRGGAARSAMKPLSRDEKMRAHKDAGNKNERRRQRRFKLLLLQEEKDRFDAMREIQDDTRRFKQYWSLGMAVLAFSILWCMGALVFMLTEARLLGLSYFESLYFCFVALLTIGYGDFSPKSNIGKPFFIVWSLIAVPTMTVLIQEMSQTVISAINRGTFKVADWTLLPKKGVLHDFLDNHPRLRDYITRLSEQRKERKRIRRGFEIQDPDEDRRGSGGRPRTPEEAEKAEKALERLAAEPPPGTEHDLARELAVTIKSVAHDVRADPPKRYDYAQWVHFTKLIRFSRRSQEEVELLEEEEGLVEWDWLGEDSPMLADITEAEWVLDRLCESLNRYTKAQARKHHPAKRRSVRISDHHHPVVDPPDTITENPDSGKSSGSSSPRHNGAMSPLTATSPMATSAALPLSPEPEPDLGEPSQSEPRFLDDSVAPDDTTTPARPPEVASRV